MAFKTIGNKSKGFWIEVQGYSGILKSLKLNQDQRKNLQAFLDKEADKVVKTAQEKVHIVSKRLHDTIRKQTGGATGKTSVRVNVVAGGKSMRGRFVGYAKAHHDINPYLDDAIAAHAHGYQDRALKAIKWKWVK